MRWRSGAACLVLAGVALACAPRVTAPAPAPTDPRAEPAAVADISATDPLLIELRRCQSIGAAGASDPDCLRAWGENRRRFLAPGARPAARIADDTSAQEN